MTKGDEMIEFEILWYCFGPEHAPNRCIGRERVRRRDLSAAIVTACNRLKAQKTEETRMARGFYVREVRDAH